MTAKVIQAVGWYFPDHTGGTEVYVDGLARALAGRGIESVVAAPGRADSDGSHRGVPVRRYRVDPPRGKGEVRGEAPHGGFSGFVRWLASQRADIYHQHSWTYGCGLYHLQAARKLGLRTVWTIHVPAPVCLRGTMTLFGRQPCDGQILSDRCAACWGSARGLPEALSRVLSRIPENCSRLALRALPASRMGSVLGRRSLVTTHRERLWQATQASDRVVAVCQWLADALRRNGVPGDKLALCRQGVVDAGRFSPKSAPAVGPLRIGFLGRWSRVKGLDLLVKAVRAVPEGVPVRLVAHAVGAEEPAGFRDTVLEYADGDPRIEFPGPVSRQGLPAVLGTFDVLAVPSQWLETGPYVVLEAQAAGVPVLGSDRGGIRELVRHGVDGWLVEASDVKQWTAALVRLARDRELLEGLRRAGGRARTIEDAAAETEDLYRSLAAPAEASPA